MRGRWSYVANAAAVLVAIFGIIRLATGGPVSRIYEFVQLGCLAIWPVTAAIWQATARRYERLYRREVSK